VVHRRKKVRKNPDRRGFPLEITTPNFVSRRVLRARLPSRLRQGPTAAASRSRDAARFRNPHFVSFMAGTNRTRIRADPLSAVLRSRALVKRALRFTLFGGVFWVVFESARAISIF
jgi:hypothetical protein